MKWTDILLRLTVFSFIFSAHDSLSRKSTIDKEQNEEDLGILNQISGLSGNLTCQHTVSYLFSLKLNAVNYVLFIIAMIQYTVIPIMLHFVHFALQDTRIFI